QQQGQNAQQAQELAELQKQIISATWKVMRREKPESPSDLFEDDVNLLVESQASALDQLSEMEGQVEDPESKQFIDSVRGFMSEAIVELNQAVGTKNVEDLRPALAKEKAAYQGLLRLRAREHEVTMLQQQSGQQQQQNNRRQQQMDQLNLKKDDNPYEDQKNARAQTEEQQQAREDRQVLNRLRELAQRQEDLNERIKELQSALEEANSDEEREEIERRLKSLREQQEQLLRDTEELSERMNQEENQERMSEESEKLEDSRDSQQRTLQSLEQGQVSRAAAEGTRAQRELEELRDEFQERTAGQFADEMRDLRKEVEDLEEKESEIARELANQQFGNSVDDQDDGQRPDLRESPKQEKDLAEKLNEQKNAVENLRERMRSTIEEAEVLEPLLAEELYDTYRNSETSRPDIALDSARKSFQRGWIDDAQAEEARAREGITQIREGIEKAAERILGDETESLRQASKTLQSLNEDLDQEINQSDPKNAGQESAQDQTNEAGSPSENGSPNSIQQPDEGDDRERSSQGNSSQDQDRESGREGQLPKEPRSSQQPPNRQEGRTEQPSDPEQSPQNQSEKNSDQQEQGSNPGQQTGADESGSPREPSETDERGEPGQQGTPNSENPNRSEGRSLNDQIRNFAIDENASGPEMRQQQMGPGNQRMMRPITGEDFRDWSDRLRDVEEMVNDPDLRAEASRIRETAREIRRELKQGDKERHSATPNWSLIRLKISQPLKQLQNAVAEELIRRTTQDALIPLDRDPVPVEYQDAVRQYYERLGRGE
ncbi:MAG: hypothetical protein AAF623_18015, partial [Planctomycetota bacterium]